MIGLSCWRVLVVGGLLTSAMHATACVMHRYPDLAAVTRDVLLRDGGVAAENFALRAMADKGPRQGSGAGGAPPPLLEESSVDLDNSPHHALSPRSYKILMERERVRLNQRTDRDPFDDTAHAHLPMSPESNMRPDTLYTDRSDRSFRSRESSFSGSGHSFPARRSRAEGGGGQTDRSVESIWSHTTSYSGSEVSATSSTSRGARRRQRLLARRRQRGVNPRSQASSASHSSVPPSRSSFMSMRSLDHH